MRVSYRLEASCIREVFSSAPDQAIVIRISCDKPEQVSLNATLTREQDGQTTVRPLIVSFFRARRRPTYVLEMPWMTPERRKAEKDQIEPTGVKFRAVLRAINEGGQVEVSGSDLIVSKANAVTMLLVAATDYRGGDPSLHASNTWHVPTSLIPLKAAHIKDHEKLFRRVEVKLEQAGSASVS